MKNLAGIPFMEGESKLHTRTRMNRDLIQIGGSNKWNAASIFSNDRYKTSSQDARLRNNIKLENRESNSAHVNR